MNNAIVILYEGVTPSEDFIKEVGIAISNSFAFGAGDVKVMHFDQNAIAKAIVRRGVDEVILPANVITLNDQDATAIAIDNAVAFIREKFKDVISTGDHIRFVLSFQKALSEAKARKALNPGVTGDNDEDAAIISAVGIIRKHADYIITKRKLSKGLVNSILTVADNL